MHGKQYRCKLVVVASSILAAATLCVPQIKAQQLTLGSHYAKAALEVTKAIESEDLHAPGHTEMIAKIEDLYEQARTDDERNVLKTVQAVYHRRLSDERLMRAYQTLTDIENDHDSSEDLVEKRRRDSAVSQFADIEETILNRQQVCFHQLEQSLAERSPDERASCAAWLDAAQSLSQGVVTSNHRHLLTVNTPPADLNP